MQYKHVKNSLTQDCRLRELIKFIHSRRIERTVSLIRHHSPCLPQLWNTINTVLSKSYLRNISTMLSRRHFFFKDKLTYCRLASHCLCDRWCTWTSDPASISWVLTLQAVNTMQCWESKLWLHAWWAMYRACMYLYPLGYTSSPTFQMSMSGIHTLHWV